MPPD
jgi:hypothetical protein